MKQLEFKGINTLRIVGIAAITILLMAKPAGSIGYPMPAP